MFDPATDACRGVFLYDGPISGRQWAVDLVQDEEDMVVLATQQSPRMDRMGIGIDSAWKPLVTKPEEW